MAITGRSSGEFSMRKKLHCILFVVLAAGLLIAGCSGNPDQEGIHGEEGVHEPNGVLDKSNPDTKSQIGDMSNDVVQISNSGEMVTKGFALRDFDKVEVAMFDVDIQKGDSFEVDINVDKNAIGYVSVAVEDGWLKIGLDPDNTYNTSDIVLTAQITMPNLTDISMSLSSTSTVSGFDSTKDVSIELDLASSLTGDWITGDCDINLALGSHLSLIGKGQDLTLVASGSSVAELAEFQVENATVRAEGGSQVSVNPNGELVKTIDNNSTAVKN
jgi:hypothetical protein